MKKYLSRFSVNLVLVPVLLAISACAGPTYYNPEEPFPEDKALIFLKQRHQSDKWTLFGTVSRDKNFGGLWRKVGGDKKGRFWAFRDPKYLGGSHVRAFMVDPGQYYLSYIEVPVAELSSITAYSPVAMVDPKKGVPVYLSFEVKAGEIAYIGSARADILRSDDKSFVRITVDDEYQEAEERVEKFYPNLANRLVKKLATEGISKNFPGELIDKF